MPAGVKALCALAMLTLLAACGPAEEPAAPEIRPVRVVTVEEAGRRRDGVAHRHGPGGDQGQPRLSHRRAHDRAAGQRRRRGRRPARSSPGSIPQNEENALRAARADLAAAKGQLVEARNNYERQRTLLRDGWTTRVRYDEARQTLETAQSQADAAQAQLNIAENRLSYTELVADCGRHRDRGRRRARRGRAGRPHDRAGRARGRARRRVRRAGADQGHGPGRSRDRGRPDDESRGDGDRPGARGRAAGRSGDRHLPGQGRARPIRPPRCGSARR